jgi:hypothetical protein
MTSDIILDIIAQIIKILVIVTFLIALGVIAPEIAAGVKRLTKPVSSCVRSLRRRGDSAAKRRP